MKSFWIACALVCSAPTASGAQADESRPPTARVEFGALALDYDPSLWTREDETTLVVRRDHGQILAVASLSVPEAASTPCTIEAMETLARGWHADTQANGSRTLRLDDLVVHVGVVTLGCRNWAGAPVAACTVAAGRLHLLTAIGGCMDLHHDSSRRVLDLLEGLKLR